MAQKIIQSFFDTDWYKITMGQVFFYQFPLAWGKWQFINRGKTEFPAGFADALKRYLHDNIEDFIPKKAETDLLQNKVQYTKPTYFEWLSTYRPDPNDLNIVQEGTDLQINYEGLIHRRIHWEVTLMACISELYYRMIGATPQRGWEDNIRAKAKELFDNKVYWADFGTRRRFSAAVQDKVCEIHKDYAPYFRGTSNPYLAMKYDLTPIGTYAHEGPMAMQMEGGLLHCNRVWIDAWIKEFSGDLGVCLPDTVTTDVFMQDFTMKYAKLFDGSRQDSGCPITYTNKFLRRYQEFGIDTTSKRIAYSDGLTVKKSIALKDQFSKVIRVSAGIGTHLTNDVGHKPLNMVIKLMAVKPNETSLWYPVVKTGDGTGKYTGDPKMVDHAMWYLGIK